MTVGATAAPTESVLTGIAMLVLLACLLACLLAPIRGSVAEVTELSARDDVHSHAERGGGYGSVEAAPRVFNRTNKRQDKQDRAQYVEEGLPNIPRVITSPETQIFIGAGHCP